MQCRLNIGVGRFRSWEPESCTCESWTRLSTPISRAPNIAIERKLKHVGAVADVQYRHLDSRYRAGGRGAKKEEVPGPASTPARSQRAPHLTTMSEST